MLILALVDIEVIKFGLAQSDTDILQKSLFDPLKKSALIWIVWNFGYFDKLPEILLYLFSIRAIPGSEHIIKHALNYIAERLIFQEWLGEYFVVYLGWHFVCHAFMHIFIYCTSRL